MMDEKERLDFFKLAKKIYKRNSDTISGILNIPILERTNTDADYLAYLYGTNEMLSKGLDCVWPEWKD